MIKFENSPLLDVDRYLQHYVNSGEVSLKKCDYYLEYDEITLL